MTIQQAFIWVFFLSLQGGSSNFLEDQTTSYVPYVRTEGEDVTMDCPTSSGSSPKFFCREECTEKDILISSADPSTWTGKYGIMWTSVTPETPDKGIFKVKISQLTKSDSGLYRCGVGGSTSSASYTYIELIVVDVMLNGQRKHASISMKPGGNLVVDCYIESQLPVTSFFLCTPEECLNIPIIMTQFTVLIGRFTFTYIDITRAKCMYVSISKLKESDSRTYRCGLKLLGQMKERSFHLSVTDALKPKLETSTSIPTSTDSAKSPEPGSPSPTPKPTNITQPSAQATSDGLVYVLVVLVIIIIVLGLALILVFTHRNIRPLGLNCRGQRDSLNMEIPAYENHLPTSGIEESVYESLDQANTEQSYSTLGYRSQDAAKSCP
ncbi:uncharacterized protein LOC121516985 [Cheilinus undulatus]|uniref:uncharacterized protein LOC121516985 n=1 Tax=Cheilinus undulatus TaxID=241271 RepID=UPI001BD4DCEC|nr:uncharacterized protein LOC121516985 [Cheilinus undulatus]